MRFAKFSVASASSLSASAARDADVVMEVMIPTTPPITVAASPQGDALATAPDAAIASPAAVAAVEIWKKLVTIWKISPAFFVA